MAIRIGPQMGETAQKSWWFLLFLLMMTALPSHVILTFRRDCSVLDDAQKVGNRILEARTEVFIFLTEPSSRYKLGQFGQLRLQTCH